MIHRLIYDLTSSWHWGHQPVGVIRTEVEVGRALRLLLGGRICFCLYVKELDCFVEMPTEVVDDFFALGIKGRFAGDGEGALRVIDFQSTDWYLSLGLDWDDKDLKSLYQRKKRQNFRVAMFCHDLIPIRFPQHCVERVARVFPSHLHQMAWCANLTFCNSNATMLDLMVFLEEIQAPRCETRVVRLAPKLMEGPGSRPPDFSDKNYLLFVSSIEPRKNHGLLLRAYLNVAARLSNPPRLVCAGMRGWGMESFFYELKKSNVPDDSVKVLSQASDEELAWLYRNCLFTVFPSLFEGWGLPIAESLGYGKFCIASITSSMPEVGGEFCDYADPFNQAAWERLLAKYILRPDLVAEKEAHIHAHHTPDTWNAVAEEIVRSISGS